MAMIKGITVKLAETKESRKDAFNHPIYEETVTEINNVLVAPSTTDEVTDTINLTGKRAIYTIAVPKGDEHTWSGNKVSFFGEDFLVTTLAYKGIDEMIPLEWNAKYTVVRYE